jgi:L-aminopeptidase/D-esterase-like protein
MAAKRTLGWMAIVAVAAAAAGSAGIVVLTAAPRAVAAAARAASDNRTLTAVGGIRVGHHTLSERPTGCTVILTGKGVLAGVDVRGGAPGTRETALLEPVNSNQQIHGIALSGGSAYGLDVASGVMRYLDEQNIGLKIGANGAINVPIVPGAVLIDLVVGGKPKIRPGADCGYAAAQAASGAPVVEGTIGAGAGATVGKFAGRDRAMKAGIGSAAIALPDGTIVAALVAVNAFGDIIDPTTNRVIAGVRTPDGRGLADARALLRAGQLPWMPPPAAPSPTGGAGSGAAAASAAAAAAAADAEALGNTTLGIIATNVTLTKAGATKVAQMAHDGFARTIAPIHTPRDGDTIFTVATGEKPEDGDVLRIGALAADVMAEAIVRAARQATSIPGYPAARDLARRHE